MYKVHLNKRMLNDLRNTFSKALTYKNNLKILPSIEFIKTFITH